MIRNLKMLGLAIVAVLAFGVVGASGASAEAMLTSDGEFTLHGEDEAEGNAFTAFGIEVECAEATYTGGAVETTEPHGLLESGATTFTVTPTYHSCLSAGFLPTTINMTGCDFVLHLVSLTSTTPTLVCPPEKHVDVTQYLSKEAHENNEPFCHETITPGHYPGGVLSNVKEGHVTLGGTVEEIEANKEGPCGEGSTNEAKLDLAVTVEGQDSKGEPTALEVSE